jgi:hypothetical protein
MGAAAPLPTRRQAPLFLQAPFRTRSNSTGTSSPVGTAAPLPPAGKRPTIFFKFFIFFQPCAHPLQQHGHKLADGRGGRARGQQRAQQRQRRAVHVGHAVAREPRQHAGGRARQRAPPLLWQRLRAARRASARPAPPRAISAAGRPRCAAVAPEAAPAVATAPSSAACAGHATRGPTVAAGNHPRRAASMAAQRRNTMPLHCTSARAFQATVRTVRTQITTQRAGEGAGARVGQQAALQPQRARLAQLPGRRGERSGCVRPRRLRHLLRVLGLGARRRLRRRQVCRPAVGRRPCAPRPRRARWSQPASAHGARRQRQLLKFKARPPAAPSADAAAAAPARGGAGAALGPGSGSSRAAKRSAVAERRATAGRSSYACAGVRLPPLPLASALRSAGRARTVSVTSPPRARARARWRRRSGHPCEPRAVTALAAMPMPGCMAPAPAPAAQAAPRKTRLLLPRAPG